MIARYKSLLCEWCEPVILTVGIWKTHLWLLALKDVGTESGGTVVFDVDVHLNVYIELGLTKDEMNPGYWMLLYVKVVSDKNCL